MTLATILSWITVPIGVYLVWTGVNAVRYFRRQEQLMGSNWVLHEFLRTCVVITAVSAVLILVRLAVLILAAPPPPVDPIRQWGGVVSGIAIVWLLLKPRRLQR